MAARPRPRSLELRRSRIIDLSKLGQIGGDETVSKFGTVEFGDRGFWAYDVALSILLVQVIWVAEELPTEQRPAWLSDALYQLRIDAVVGDLGFVIELSWPVDGVELLVTLLAEANRRMAALKTITADEVACWQILGGDTICLRGARVVDLTPVIELGEATIELIRGTLPWPPVGTWWMYGFPSGRSIVNMREPA